MDAFCTWVSRRLLVCISTFFSFRTGRHLFSLQIKKTPQEKVTNVRFFSLQLFSQVDSFPLDQQSIEIPETECSDSCENDVDMDESDSCDNDGDDNDDSEGKMLLKKKMKK